MEPIDVELLGRRYALRTDRPKEHLDAVASLVERRMRDITGGGTFSRDHLVLLGLNLGSELVLGRESELASLERLERALDALLQRMDALVEPSGGR